jgi:PAS domain S-box-containing protein
MNKKEYIRHSSAFHFTVIAMLVIAYLGLAVYFQLVLHKGVVYTHFAYLPIVLASIWWGKKGVLVALLLAGFILLFHLFGIGYGERWDDVTRIFFFVVVALFIGALSEKVMAGQRAQRESEEKYRLLIEKSLNGIMAYRNNTILFANSRSHEILGYDSTGLVGKSVSTLIYEQDKPRWLKIMEKRKTDGASDLHYECRLVRGDGRAVWADIASSVTAYEGMPAILVHIHDITGKKEAEEERRNLAELAQKQNEQLVHSIQLAEMGEMAASVAHELNQPLTGIRNFAKNAIYMIEEDAGDSGEIKENLNLISQQVDRASKIINQMRDLTRRSERRFEPVDLNRTVKEIVEFLSPQLKLSQVDVILDLAPQLPEVLGDRIRLEQVFLNLITNARQAMENSEVRRLEVKSYYDGINDYRAVIEISDTGKGFLPEQTEKLFRPFYTTKKVGRGTGLGLSVSLNIIQEHEGSIEALGGPGKGARFKIILPFVPEQNPQEASVDK